MGRRDELRAKGAARRREMGLAAYPADGPGRDLAALVDEVALGEIWSRPGLGRRERMIATLAALAALERATKLVEHVPAALTCGLDASALGEIVIQAGLYVGFPAAETALAALTPALARAGAAAPPAHPGDEPDLDGLDRLGRETMRALHGAGAESGYAAPGSGAPSALYGLAIRYGYGVLWNRPGLSRRERFVVSLSAFTVLEQGTQLEKFARSATAAELTFDEAVEVIVQCAPYGGFPRALNALVVLERIRTAGG